MAGYLGVDIEDALALSLRSLRSDDARTSLI
jgi:hypothetical protein